jgi:undecaprenyl-diphosphatase
MEWLIDLDKTLFYLINHDLSHDILDAILIPIRNPFVWAPLYIFIIGFVLFNFKKKSYWFLLLALLNMGTSDIVSSRVIKPSIERLRPCHPASGVDAVVRVRCGSAYSFTSSHATNHFALATFLTITLGFVLGKFKMILFVWAFLISLAQVYVGVHFPVDIIVGSLIGTTIGLIYGTLFMKYYGLEPYFQSLTYPNDNDG